MTNLSDLISRVSAASGADEQLDADIMCALAAPAGAYVEQSPINGAWCIYTTPGRLWEKSSRNGWHRHEGWTVTASVDAALAFCARVLPGWLVKLEIQPSGHPSTAWVYWSIPQAFRGEGPTPALALLAALLKAVQASSCTDQRQGERAEDE